MVEHGKEKRESALLMPFYVNRTVTSEERAQVAADLASNELMRREFEALEEIRITWQSMPESEYHDCPGEEGLKRLLAEIGPDTVPPQPGAFAVPVPANTNAPIWARMAALAAAAAFGALLSVAVLQPSAEEPFAEMVSGPSIMSSVGPSFTVVFQPDASLEAISGALREQGLTVVDGPSAVGLFRLARVDGVDPTLAEAEALRVQTDLFDMVDDPE
jgi:hypothetical protein